jgi:hypothetical protein
VLERYRHQSEVGAHHVDDQVVSAGESDRRDHIAGGRGMNGVVPPGAGNRPHPVPELAVADGVELGQEAYRCAAGAGIGHQLTGTLPKRGTIGITLDERLKHFGQTQTGRAGCVDDLGNGSCGAELRIIVKQLGRPAAYPLLLAVAELGE